MFVLVAAHTPGDGGWLRDVITPLSALRIRWPTVGKSGKLQGQHGRLSQNSGHMKFTSPVVVGSKALDLMLGRGGSSFGFPFTPRLSNHDCCSMVVRHLHKLPFVPNSAKGSPFGN